jgi:CRP-like cAMP-binding protein
MGGSQAQVRAHLVHVTEYLEEKTVPLGMHPAIKAHWKFVLASSLGMDEGQLLEQLPTRMAQQILFFAHEHVIEKISIFRSIERKSIILHIFRLMEPCFFVNGSTLFDEGGMANHVYFITDGVVELTKRVLTGADVKAVTIAHVETGGFVGHSGLMLSARQPYTAKALDGDCECYSLSNATISNVTEDLPFIAIHLQFALSTALAEQDEHLSAGARLLRAERLRNIDSPTTVKFVERRSDRQGSGRTSPMTAGSPTRTPTARPSLSDRSGRRTLSTSPGGARRSMSMSPSMSRGDSSISFDSEGTPKKPPMKMVTSIRRRLTTTFSAKVAIEEDAAAPEANPIDSIFDVHASENLNVGRMGPIPRSNSCPELESGYGISSTTSKGKPLLGLGVEEAALRSQRDFRTIYRNRSISRMAPDSVEN